MPSFDIVSKVDIAEVDNAIANMRREMEHRYDFKNAKCTVERKDSVITLEADDDMKLRQMHELLNGHVSRRGMEAGVLDYQKPEKAAGQSMRQTIKLREGIDKELARRLVKEIKSTKLKVQPAIMGDEVRVTGKKRDDLQAAMETIKDLGLDQPFQYVNFRD
ncbi:MAG: YajQ family cyclic di-GMP-binding protein [Parvularculales bacterium]